MQSGGCLSRLNFTKLLLRGNIVYWLGRLSPPLSQENFPTTSILHDT